ncbi:MAG: hypothetical protein BWX99_02109 [Deltaproteobacteria bacterium ADurb.Bin151]|nr:MAG: hypothetical protein BWX99_02109 [Deltaproteobacteria bacterium ADurb.Bin151]
MNIGCPAGTGIIDHFIDQLHDHAVGFRDHFSSVIFIVEASFFIIKFAEEFCKRMFGLRSTEKQVDEFQDVFGQSDVVLYFFCFQKVLDGVSLQNIVGIIDYYMSPSIDCFQWHP